MKKLVCILVFLSCLWGSFAIGFGELGGLSAFVPINLGIRVYLGNMPDFGNLKADWNKGMGNINALQANLIQMVLHQRCSWPLDKVQSSAWNRF